MTAEQKTSDLVDKPIPDDTDLIRLAATAPVGDFSLTYANLKSAIRIGLTSAESAAGLTQSDIDTTYDPGNVLRYGAKGDGVTDDYTAINNARLVSDQAYFGGQQYTVFFPNSAGNTGRYMVSQQIVIDRNGTHWRGEMPVRRSQPVAIAFLASATDTTLIKCTSEAPNFENISFEGFSVTDRTNKLIELHPQPRLARASEQTQLGLDGVTLYNFEDVDAEFNNCNFQYSAVAIHIYGRGLYVDNSEFFAVTVGVDLDREAVIQQGKNAGQETDTGLRVYAIRETRFHGMGVSSAAIRNTGSHKNNMAGVQFVGNYIDAICTVMYGPISDSTFDCEHIAIENTVFDAKTIGTLGDATGTYENVNIAGNYNSRMFRNETTAVTDTLDENEIVAATIISISDTTGFTANSSVLIQLDNGQTHRSTIASVQANVSVTINDGIPSAASIGNIIDQVLARKADNFLYATGLINVNIDAAIRDVFKDVFRVDGSADTLSVRGTFYDVLEGNDASGPFGLLKLNGGTFNNITVSGAVQTGSYSNNNELVQCVGTFTLNGYNFDGLSFDPSEWDAFSTVDNSLSPAMTRNEIVTATNVITVSEGGKTFYLNSAGGFTSTLPAPVDGLKYTFIVKTAPTTAYVITTNSSANILYGTYLDIVGELTYFSAQDTLNFVASTALIGDRLEVESDGTRWYCKAFSGADGGITVAVT